MNRKSIYAWILVLLVAFVSLPIKQAAAGTTGYYYDFEQSLKPWIPASSLDKCVDGKTLLLAQENGKGMVPGQNHFAQLASACGSNTWMLASLRSDATKFTVSFSARAVDACDACIPIVYVGDETPGYPGQFTTDYQTLSDAWTSHQITVQLFPNPKMGKPTGENVIVALGFARLDMGGVDDGPGTLQVGGFDNIKITSAKDVVCLGCDPNR